MYTFSTPENSATKNNQEYKWPSFAAIDPELSVAAFQLPDIGLALEAVDRHITGEAAREFIDIAKSSNVLLNAVDGGYLDESELFAVTQSSYYHHTVSMLAEKALKNYGSHFRFNRRCIQEKTYLEGILNCKGFDQQTAAILFLYLDKYHVVDESTVSKVGDGNLSLLFDICNDNGKYLTRIFDRCAAEQSNRADYESPFSCYLTTTSAYTVLALQVEFPCIFDISSLHQCEDFLIKQVVYRTINLISHKGFSHISFEEYRDTILDLYECEFIEEYREVVAQAKTSDIDELVSTICAYPSNYPLLNELSGPNELPRKLEQLQRVNAPIEQWIELPERFGSLADCQCLLNQLKQRRVDDASWGGELIEHCLNALNKLIPLYNKKDNCAYIPGDHYVYSDSYPVHECLWLITDNTYQLDYYDYHVNSIYESCGPFIDGMYSTTSKSLLSRALLETITTRAYWFGTLLKLTDLVETTYGVKR